MDIANIVAGIAVGLVLLILVSPLLALALQATLAIIREICKEMTT